MQIEQNTPLAPFTTLRIGGPARFFASVKSEADLLDAVRFASEQRLPLFVLGGGSNVLVPDEGYPGLVVHMEAGGEISSHEAAGQLAVEVSGRFDWDRLVRSICEQGISGIECLAGIPGLVGGSPIQNIGAYGQEVSQTVARVRALDLETLEFVSLSHGACGFGYRKSIFNSTSRGRYLITQVDFLFSREAQPNLSYADVRKYFADRPTPNPTQIAEAVREIRAAKGMYLDPNAPSPDHRSAGSFFKNPIVPSSTLAHIAKAQAIAEEKIPHWPTLSGEVKLPAAWLIEQAGFAKGFSLGPVGISSRHTLALINRSGSATYAELLQLRDLIAGEVKARFDVNLEQEPVLMR